MSKFVNRTVLHPEDCLRSKVYQLNPLSSLWHPLDRSESRPSRVSLPEGCNNCEETLSMTFEENVKLDICQATNGPELRAQSPTQPTAHS